MCHFQLCKFDIVDFPYVTNLEMKLLITHFHHLKEMLLADKGDVLPCLLASAPVSISKIRKHIISNLRRFPHSTF